MEMFNTTSSNDEVNSTSSNDEVIDNVFRTVTFVLVTFPTSVLSGLCVVAILIAKAINLPMKVLLLNIFASLFTLLFSKGLFQLVLSIQVLENDFPCKFTYSMGIVSTTMETCSVVLYAVMVYIFVKYSRNKLKWYVLIPFITISWTISILLGLIPFIQDWKFTNNCREVVQNSSLLIPIIVLIWLVQITGCVVVSTFGILTYCYIKHNTLEEDHQIKKAIAKSLFYLVAKTILTAITDVLPPIIPTIRSSLTTTTTKVLFSIFSILLINLPGILTPIMMIVALEPLRKAMKETKKKLQSCCKTNVVHPSNST